MIRTRRLIGAGVVACAGLLSIPAAGQAATTATVTGDTGAPTAIVPQLTLRNMSPQTSVAFGPSDQQYRISYTFTPAGGSAQPVDAFSDRTCSSVPTQRVVSNDLPYLGNGVYAISVQTSTDSKDFDCAKLGAAQSYSFTVAASTAITPAPAKFLMRNPGVLDSNELALPVDFNPGATGVDVQIGKGAVAFNPDGSIQSPLVSTSVVAADPVIRRKFFESGDYTFVARATRGSLGTAWSAPVKTRIVEPFDLVSAPYCTDCRGPRYKITGRVRAARPSGKITVYVKRKGAKKFRKVGSGRIRKTRNFGVKFRQSRDGRYQIKYVFKGSSFVLGGSVTYKGYRFTTRRF